MDFYKLNLSGFKTKENFVALLTLLFIAILLVLPSQFEGTMYINSEKVKAKVISTDNSQIRSSGMISYGEQVCAIEILEGKFKGIICEATNDLNGQLEMDKMFAAGDRAFVVVDYEGTDIMHAVLIDHYRLDLELCLVIGFIVVLLIFARGIGFRAILSFVFTILMMWKVLIPFFLLGYNPIAIGMGFTAFNIIIIIALVYGFDRRSFAAIGGALAGTAVTGIMAIFFVSAFKIHGAIMPFSESLLYSGYQNIDLTQIFTASIFIAASGAMMDIAVDISAAVDELLLKKPDLTRKELIKSGMNIGRAVMGTMLTTLLLAYSGGYIGLLMVFMAQGTPIDNILNLKYVSSEILHTMIGSFGLVTVAPFTAVFCGLLYTKK